MCSNETRRRAVERCGHEESRRAVARRRGKFYDKKERREGEL